MYSVYKVDDRGAAAPKNGTLKKKKFASNRRFFLKIDIKLSKMRYLVILNPFSQGKITNEHYMNQKRESNKIMFFL